MATYPSPENAAREILAIFVKRFNCRADEVLRLNNFVAIWDNSGFIAEDFNLGMEFAATKGWVEIQQDGYKFRLTSEGFKEA